jgi:hypothetical protein
MSLTRLDNLYSSKTGKYLYVSPDDFNASDTLDNRGNSPLRPFKTIQRAFIEVSRFSYQPGTNNDRFDQFSIMLMPGDHYIDNRPGLVNYSIGGANSDRNRYYDAGNLIELNKQFIAYEAYAKMLNNNSGFTPSTGSVIDYIDNVVGVLDALIYNIKFGGNDKVFDAALIYQNNPALIANDQAESLEVYANAAALVKKVIAQAPVQVLYQGSYLTQLNIGEAFTQNYDGNILTGPSVYGQTGADVPYGQDQTCADVKSTVDVLFTIVADGINENLNLEDRNEPETFGELPLFNFNQENGQWEDNSIIDLRSPDNIYWKFNASTGGTIVPRGCSLVGYDLRRTIIRPLYVPDPADSNQARTSIFNLTGGCYLWQFTIKDGDLSNNSPLFNVADNVGKVYYQKGNVSDLAVPEYSHHKICIMEYAETKELDAYYKKVAIAFSKYQPTINSVGEFDALVQENRIVGPLSDTRSIESIKVIDTNIGQPNQKIVLQVTTKIDHGYFRDQYVAILNTGLDEETNGTFKVASISQTNPRLFTYEIPGKVAAGLGLTNNQTYQVGAGLSNNAVAQAEIDSVESASPYVFNCSIRSTWGMCGMWADGSKATGFKSMVVAQYTGVSLQKDDRAFIRYDKFTNTWNQASLRDSFATVPYHTKGDAYWKDDWRNFHIRASEDSFIQCVSVFAVGFFDHFLMESGGDMSITNSNSNFGNTSLHSVGHKGYAFNQDKGGYITDIIPPQELSGGYGTNPNIASTNSSKIPYYPIDIVASNDLSNTTKLFLGSDSVYDPASRPAATLNGYRIGARPNEKIFLKLEEQTPGSGENFSATLSPTGVQSYNVALDFLNPTGITIDQKAQDAANLINANKEYIQDEVYGYITTKYPQLLTDPDLTMSLCRRDVGYYVDAVVQDLKLGGNINTIQAAEAYFVGGQLTYIADEKNQTIDALGVTRDLCISAMRNWDYLLTGCSCTNNSSVITVPSTQGLVVGMKVSSYNTINPSNNTQPVGSPSATIPTNSYIVQIINQTSIRIGEKGQWIFGSYSYDPSPANKVATQTITASGPGTGLKLLFKMRDEVTQTSQNNVVAVRDGIFSTKRTVYDDTVVQDIVNLAAGETECSDIQSIISGYFVDIATILSSPFGQDGVERIEANTDFSALSKRATIFTVTGGNPHGMETGTAVRLVPKPRPGTNPDQRVVRLPKGFNTNTKYYIITPGRKTSPEDYSATTAFGGQDQTVFMLASTLENARAGNYIYSPETEAIDPDVIIEINKYIIDQSYDLYQYKGNVSIGAGSGVIETDLAHSFDLPVDGIEPQKVFFRKINVDTPLPSRTIQIGSTSYQVALDPQDEFYTRYINNNLFAIYSSFEDARDDNNRVVLNGLQKFLVFANKRFSPLKFDPSPLSYGVRVNQTGQWYLQVKNETNQITNILRRLTIPEDTTYSGSAPAATRSNDTFFERVDDNRISKDRVYKLRYVIPKYLETVRNPLNGFVIKVRTDTKRRLRPQKLVLKPVTNSAHSTNESYTSTSLATFINNGTFDTTGIYVNTAEKLGRSVASYTAASVAPVYDPYINPKIVETKNGKIAFSIQSAKVITENIVQNGQSIGYKYLEVVAFDHTINNQSIKNERFTVVQISAPDGIGFTANATQNNPTNLIQWSGNSSGTGYLHGYFTTSNLTANPKTKNPQRYYLIIKNITDGEVNYNSIVPTTFFQGGTTLSGALVTGNLIANPDSIGDPKGKSKSTREDYLYAVQGSNVYTLVPGDIITDDTGNDYYIDSVDDVGELDDTFYIFDIQEIKERIPGQQDGIYYLICLKGNVSPYPTGPGVGENFKKYKFSQPISYLYPQDYKNDPLWFKQIGADLNDPPATYSAADNYVHGLVTVNDSRYSETKEAVQFFVENGALAEYTYDNDIQTGIDARLRAKSGNAVAGAEDRKIPIKGVNAYPTDSKLYVELRRPSIARSGNHTFEYLGFGPGNYSTGFPLRQEVILTDKQDFYAQAKREDGGIVFYTGLNSNGDLYIGNKKINAITGEEKFLESAELIGSGDEDDQVGDTLVTTFETPVTFNNKITVNGPSSFTKPVTIQVDAIDAIAPTSALRIQSLVDSVNLGDDATLSRASFSNRSSGDITLSKNRIQSAIFGINPRGNIAFTGQSYSIRTHYQTERDSTGAFTVPRPSNVTPEQSSTIYDAGNPLTTSSNRLFGNQQVYYGNVSNVPSPGDILLKGKEVGRSGSLGWIYANTFLDIPNSVVNTVATPKRNQLGQLVVGAGTGPEYTATNLVRLTWASQGGSQLTNSNIAQNYGLTVNSLIRIIGVVGDLSNTFNGTFTIYQSTFNINAPFIDVEVNSNIASVDIVETWSTYQPNAIISVSNSSWKEVGVVGSEAIRTETIVLGNYKLGINTVARSPHSAYATGYVDSATTDPRANLDVVGNVFISGKEISNYRLQANPLQRTITNLNNAFLVGGDAYLPNNAAVFRISTTNNGRVGINVTNDQLNGTVDGSIYNRAFSVQGSTTISGSARIEQNLEINGAPNATYSGTYTTANLTSRAATFNLLNTATGNNVTILNMGGSMTSVFMFHNTTATQIINIGTSAANDPNSTNNTTFNVHTASSKSTVNIGTVADILGNTSRITFGGAIKTRNNSEFLIKNYRTTLEGKLIIRGNGSDTGDVGFLETEGVTTFNMFPEGVKTLNIGSRVGTLNLAGSSGTTTVRNSINVKGSALVESDITLLGGLRNTSVGIERNVFGTVSISSISRLNNIATVNTSNPHGLTNGQQVTIVCSEGSFTTSGTVQITVVDLDTFTYPNSGTTQANIVVTGRVLTGIGNTQAVGNVEENNLNVDYYSLVEQIAPARTISTVNTQFKLLLDFNYLSGNDSVKFLDVGNLTGVSTGVTYYVLSSDNSGVILTTTLGTTTPIPISLAPGSTDAGNARIILAFTSIDTQGDIPWGGQTFLNSNGTYRLYLNNPSGLTANQYLLIDKEVLFTVADPSPLYPYYVDVLRGRDGTAAAAHADGNRIYLLAKEVGATFIFPSPITATQTNVNLGEFSAPVKSNDFFRLNPGSGSDEWVKITQINLSNAQKLIVNNGDQGDTINPRTPIEVFKVVSTTGNTRVIGDLTIGYDVNSTSLLDDDFVNSNSISQRTGIGTSTSTGAGLDQTGGGNLRVHNSVEISGNQITTLPGRQYFLITNGQVPRFFVESHSGDTTLFGGGDLRIFSDNYYTTGGWTKTRTNSAVNLKFEVLGDTGNTKIAGTLRAGDDFRVGTLVDVNLAEGGSNFFTSRFSVDAQTGSTISGQSLTITGQLSATPSAGVPIFDVTNLGISGAKSFTINQDASIDAFSEDGFYTRNGGRKCVFVSEQGNTDATARVLRPNLIYAVRPTSNLVLKLPSIAVTGDMIRIVDVGGALNFAVNLVIRSPQSIQGSIGGTTIGGLSSVWTGGELVINTPNAAFGLIYLADTDGDSNSVPGANQGWFLMEI